MLARGSDLWVIPEGGEGAGGVTQATLPQRRRGGRLSVLCRSGGGSYDVTTLGGGGGGGIQRGS